MGKLASPDFVARDDGKPLASMSLAVSDLTANDYVLPECPEGSKCICTVSCPRMRIIRSCVFRQDGSGWFVCLQIAVPTPEKRAITSVIGVDLGLTVFAYCSDNVPIPNPRFARRAEKELRRRQRALSRCQRGSHRRHKVRAQVARVHRTITNTRNSWLHKESAGLVSEPISSS